MLGRKILWVNQFDDTEYREHRARRTAQNAHPLLSISSALNLLRADTYTASVEAINAALSDCHAHVGN